MTVWLLTLPEATKVNELSPVKRPQCFSNRSSL